MNKSNKSFFIVNIILSVLLIGMLVYAFLIQPNQQKKQRLEEYRSTLFFTIQSGEDLCGDRIDRENTEVFSDTRDTFRMRQGMLNEAYHTTYNDMSALNTPNALLLLGEYSATRAIPTDSAAYAYNSDSTIGQFILISTEILYDACGSSSPTTEDVLNKIEADTRTQQAIALIDQIYKETSQKVQDPNMTR